MARAVLSMSTSGRKVYQHAIENGVLLRPLANRDEDRLVYIRQSAPGIGAANASFSVPEKVAALVGAFASNAWPVGARAEGNRLGP